jgi:hypothetical protein
LVSARIRRSATSSSVRVTGQVIRNMTTTLLATVPGYEWQK